MQKKGLISHAACDGRYSLMAKLSVSFWLTNTNQRTLHCFFSETLLKARDLATSGVCSSHWRMGRENRLTLGYIISGTCLCSLFECIQTILVVWKVWQILDKHLLPQDIIKKVCQHTNQLWMLLEGRLGLSQQSRVEENLLHFWIHANAGLAGHS